MFWIWVLSILPATRLTCADKNDYSIFISTSRPRLFKISLMLDTHKVTAPEGSLWTITAQEGDYYRWLENFSRSIRPAKFACFTDRDHPVSNVLFPKDTSPLPTETGLMVPQWLLALRNAFSFYPPSYLLQKKAIKDIKLILGVKFPLHAYAESQGVIPASATQSLFMRSDVQWSCSQVGKHV